MGGRLALAVTLESRGEVRGKVGSRQVVFEARKVAYQRGQGQALCAGMGRGLLKSSQWARTLWTLGSEELAPGRRVGIHRESSRSGSPFKVGCS